MHLPTYIRIARPDHWIKNIFMIPGTVLALLLVGDGLSHFRPWAFLGAATVLCLISSANYVINEFLDAESDRFHPMKSKRAGARGKLKAFPVLSLYAVLAAAGLALAYRFGTMFFVTAEIFLIMGTLYNVRPIRTKDVPYLDVLTEAINNPLRFLLGWFVVIGNALPPSSVLISYWMGGAFLMAMKRYSEYRHFADKKRIGQYRKSFKYYNEERLLLSSFFYALNSTFFLGVFLIKYRIEYVLSLPFITVLFVWYFKIAMKENSAAQAPEKLYGESAFLSYAFLVCAFLGALTYLDLPALQILVEPVRY
ncbi:MAG: UbiA family prenyltransferase [Alphaproteobacteria bacterium]|nr:UbiA family prenyltransferase [Alphaproteobacteria bacterium]